MNIGIKKVKINFLKNHFMSSSTYQPESLHLIVALNPVSDQDMNGLLLQFNHFDTWLQVPEMEEHCQAYMVATDSKSNYLKFAKQRISIGDTSSAISTLETCKRDDWPEIYR